MRIAIVGAGGVGGYLAALLDGRAELGLVDDGEHLRALQSEGIRVQSQARGELHAHPRATDRPAELGPVDLVLFCVKAYDNRAAISAMRPLVGPATSILTVQNGIGNVEQLAEAFGAERVLGGAMNGGGTRVAPGILEHTQAIEAEWIELGPIDDGPKERAELARAALDGTGMAIRVVDDIQRTLWTKLLSMAGMAALGCLTRCRTAEWRGHPLTRELYATLVREAVAVGRAEGIALADDDVERALKTPDLLGPAHRTSIHADLERGERLEIEAVHGEVVRRAARRGVAVPAYQAAYAVLRHADDRAAEAGRR